MTKHLVPATIAEQRGFLGRPDNIDKEDRGKNTTGLDRASGGTGPDSYPFQQPFIAMAAPARNCSFHVV
jgi:hypothetical protein